MKIYTKSGDAGSTDVYVDGRRQRVPKNHIRMQAIGEVDELNAHIGSCNSFAHPFGMSHELIIISQSLFELGADLATKRDMFRPVATKALEDWIDHWESTLPPLKNFILPGGSEGSARFHLARTVCRRAERSLVTLADAGHVIPVEALPYINRLSDYLFVAARVANQYAETKDIVWSERVSKSTSNPAFGALSENPS